MKHLPIDNSTASPIIQTGKNSITLQLEELTPPEKPLKELPLKEVLAKFSNKIEAHSSPTPQLVANGYHSFIHGMYQAYSEHRPFVLSPDMIWLLICQGFSHHVNFNHQTKKEVFPHLQKKQKLFVKRNLEALENSHKMWEEVPTEFTQQIMEYVGFELIDTLRADFSTTGMAERVASEITIMDALKPYFEYIMVMCICGIPSITIEGNQDDWERIIDKTLKLKKYGLEEWVNKLMPLLKEFVAVYKGNIDKVFWRNMFKVHTLEDYGDPKRIDGWILNFYPYDRKGNKIDFRGKVFASAEGMFKMLPKEIVSVNFEYQLVDDNEKVLKKRKMEYWAGFLGLSQNKEDFQIRPEIGWFVAEKEDAGQNIIWKEENIHARISELSSEEIAEYTGFAERFNSGRIYYNLKELPEDLFLQKEYRTLVLNFNHKIKVPLKLVTLSLDILAVNGKISIWERLKLKLLFGLKKTTVKINDRRYK
ncbi:MAG: DUF4419 domain-containing protein [Chitinophagales bacterium]